MSDFAIMRRWDGDPRIAILLIENPPVNAMSIGVARAAIAELDAANADSSIAGVVLAAGGSGVFGGADVKQQGKGWPPGEPTLSDLIAAIEGSPKPVAVLLSKAALGGGLEIGLGGRFRLATAGTRLGQPEVKLGIPPGAGGTQRLPRLVGVKRALEMILQGEPILAEEGARIGLIDTVIPSDEQDRLGFAARFLRDRIDAGDLPPPVSARPVAGADPAEFDAVRSMAAKRSRGQTAPLVCIDCVEQAGRSDFADGLRYERARFEECVVSDQAVALRHVFFAERQARKVVGLDTDANARPIARVAVLGAGTMGTGIALCFAAADLPVTLIERDAAALESGLKTIADTLDGLVARGRLDAEARAAQERLVAGSVDLEGAVPSADLVVEAVFEDRTVKQEIFGRLAQVAKPDAILATNTSYLDVDAIAAAAPGRETDVLGLHFFSPAHVMKLLEVVRASKTSDATLLTGLEIGRRLGKTAVVAGVCEGFIGNRLFTVYNREAEFLLQEGASVAQVDSALKDFGMPMGSFAVRDLAGLDISWAKRKAAAHRRDPAERYSKIGDILCEQGWFGRKTGKGFYLYPDGKPEPNPDLSAIIAQTAEEAGISPGPVDEGLILERCLYALVLEGAHILEEGIAQRASDIDLVYINGYGFPRWRGGPMHWADRTGLPTILETIQKFHAEHDFWAPAPLLERLVAEGKSFADWDRERL
ncbi:MAG: 3-hydroxyacyl-CoA dehydrogenase NAD-binding domain-containing protein [Alphaproteobacteria bacterium]|nr:3-hydroxyacyl-CoA dehydrogenase NAD-binding domain-containing protein [Alphaproteobacteria bacterium]